MNQHQKYKLVPQDVLEQTVTPAVKHKISLSHRMRDILDEKATSSSEQFVRYYSVLMQYLNMNDQLPQSKPTTTNVPSKRQKVLPKPTPMDVDDPVDKLILKDIAWEKRKSATSLIKALKKDDNVSWTDSGQLMYKNELIPESNLRTIIHDLTAKYDSQAPPGMTEVLQSLKAQAVNPKQINNPSRKATYSPAKPRRSQRGTRYEIRGTKRKFDYEVP